MSFKHLNLHHLFDNMPCRKTAEEPMPDVSHPAQIVDITASFPSTSEPINLKDLRHPNKPDLRAVESYEILPDSGIWANDFDLVKFSERPGERPLDVSA
jgi:RNA polymerase II-associated factor 1